MMRARFNTKKITGLLAVILALGLTACASKQEFSTDTLQISEEYPQVRFFIDKDTITVFDTAGKNPKKLQELNFGEVTDLEFSKEMFTAEDLNFDGNSDIRMPSSRGATNVYSYVWLWDETTKNFVYHEELSALSLLEADPVNKIITTVESGGAAESTECTYDWVDGKLTLLNEIRSLADIATGAVTEIRTERQADGSYKKTEIKQ